MAQPFPTPPPAPVRTCYRHTGQPAGVVCQRCDRPICPACMHQASVGFHCPECVKKGAQKVYRGPAALAGNQPILTQILIAVNVAVFVLGIVMTGANALDGTSKLVEHGGLLAQGTFDGRTLDGVAEGQWYRLITSGFLHYGIIHLAFNMYALWILGGLIEKSVGRVQLAIVYFVSLLGGVARRAHHLARRAHRGRLGRHLRPDGRGARPRPQPRHQHPQQPRARRAGHQPAAHLRRCRATSRSVGTSAV